MQIVCYLDTFDNFFQENIAKYLEGCNKLGMPSQYLFDTLDLHEAKDFYKVFLYALTYQRLRKIYAS